MKQIIVVFLLAASPAHALGSFADDGKLPDGSRPVAEIPNPLSAPAVTKCGDADSVVDKLRCSGQLLEPHANHGYKFGIQ